VKRGGRQVDKRLLCAQRPCPGFYSSMNFVLLGFIAQVGRAAARRRVLGAGQGNIRLSPQ
jgi:hypothetical protein